MKTVSKKPPRRTKAKRKQTPIESVLRKRVLPPNRGTKGRGSDPMWQQAPLEKLSQMELFSIQLDQKAGIPDAELAKRFNLSLSEIRAVGKMKLNLTGAARERFEATATSLLRHAHRALDSITDEKLEEAGLQSLSIMAGITLDKAIQIDKHLHGTRDGDRQVLVEFGSREALEKALVRKFEQNPLFKARLEGRVLEAQVELVGSGETKLLSSQVVQGELFPGSAETLVPEEEVPVMSSALFKGKTALAGGLLRKTSVSKKEVRDDERVEEDLSRSFRRGGSRG